MFKFLNIVYKVAISVIVVVAIVVVVFVVVLFVVQPIFVKMEDKF